MRSDCDGYGGANDQNEGVLPRHGPFPAASCAAPACSHCLSASCNTLAACALSYSQDEGNKHFSAGNYAAAAECYSKGLTIWEDAPAEARITMGSGFPQIPVMQIVVEYADIGNILRNNRAACYLKLGLFLEVRAGWRSWQRQ